ncbi:hypothetical protein J2Z76_001933 [Sedimentibacter acidaminivorans]|uniref:RCK N-terminal domain-containing protein n=1 Tax=Sedimentibacter acidaminivorans TaxID=913099 RepID=A0ABS4GEF4_9FIRM|nr:hypothetical protein [Sedimentibacter acidaminivorans]MBP1926069.1 hypothetical protein [Sedimentibacter acidaminivorans]
MDFIIVISMIIIFYLGFIFIDKICVLLNPKDFIIDDKNSILNTNSSQDILLFGDNEISFDIAKILENYNISYSMITKTNEINEFKSYKFIFAVDKFDLENLMICSLGKKMMNSTEFIAICNCPYNKKIFEDNHIPYLYGDNIQASQIVKILFSSSMRPGGISDVHIQET